MSPLSSRSNLPMVMPESLDIDDMVMPFEDDTDGETRTLRQRVHHLLPTAEPDWQAIQSRLLEIDCASAFGISTWQLMCITCILEKPGRWEALQRAGQWDPMHRVRHIRPSDLPEWHLPRALQIHRGFLFVLGVGINYPRAGQGSFKRVAYAVELNTLTPLVYCTVGKLSCTNLSRRAVLSMARKEANLLNRLDGSPCVAQMYYSIDYHAKPSRNGHAKFGMMLDRCNVGDLGNILVEAKDSPWNLQIRSHLPTLLQIVRDMLEILVALQEHRVIDRDIKLENLMLHQDQDGRLRLKLIDLGLGNTIEDEIAEMYPGSPLVGSRGYLAPEYVWEEDSYVRATPKGDVWAMGVALLVTLFGGFPQFCEQMLESHATQDEVDDLLAWARQSTPDVQDLVRPWCLLSPKGTLILRKFLNLLRCMLVVDPRNRASGPELLRTFDVMIGEI